MRKRSGSGNLQSTGARTRGCLGQPQAVQDSVSTCPRFRTVSAFRDGYKPVGFFHLRLRLGFKRNHKKCQACIKQGTPEKLSQITGMLKAGGKLTLRSVAMAVLGVQASPRRDHVQDPTLRGNLLVPPKTYGQVPFRVDAGCRRLLLHLGHFSIFACGILVLRGKQISGCRLSSHFSYEEAPR